MSDYDSTADTQDHISKVQWRLKQMRDQLYLRGEVHDLSKLREPEKSIFDVMTPRLKELTYGSYEYQMALGEMHEALAHHYQANSHHPEHYTRGIDGMSLLDLVEMLCDWKAATERVADGDIVKSLEINKARFGISDQLTAILLNTVLDMKWQYNET
jgi:hypothetical protein